MKEKYTTFAVLVLLSTFSLAQVPSYVPTNGLVGWWPFTGNAVDSSGNGHDGTLYGATLISDRFGSPNCAYSYNGSSYISVPHSSAFSFGTGDYTLSA